jgi:hypothetical protein
MEPIRIQLTEADNAAACLLHLRPTLSFVGVWTALIAVGLVLYLGPGFPDPLPYLGMITAAAAGGALLSRLVLMPVLTPYNARAAFRESKALSEPQEMTWNDEGLAFAASTWTATPPWSQFLKWREGKSYYLLYSSRGSFRIVPKRAFKDETVRAAFERAIREKIARRV